MNMRNMMTLVGGVALGAGVMYLMDPERGERRRAQLRDVLEDVGQSELVDRARGLEPLTAARQLGGEALRRFGGDVGAVPDLAAALTRLTRGRGWRRRRLQIGEARDWALLGGIVGAITAGLWLARRAVSTGDGIEVVRTITVEAPVERVWEFWNDFENFPRFLSHVREVKRTGPDRTHWVVAGPGGAPVEWDAVVTTRVPHEEIAWRTVEGTLIEHEGSVHFHATGHDVTQLQIRMLYRPVGGSLAHGVVSVLGRDPASIIGDDLSRLAGQLRGVRPAVGETSPWR
jgi:uncharacterized membrane protein